VYPFGGVLVGLSPLVVEGAMIGPLDIELLAVKLAGKRGPTQEESQKDEPLSYTHRHYSHGFRG